MVFVFNLKLASEYVVDSYRPFEYWMTYKEVESAESQFRQGEFIEMISKRTVSHDVKTRWIDVLYCKRDRDEEYKRISQADTGGSILRQADYRESGWLYAGRQPIEHAYCYMLSDIILSPSPFVEKTHTVRSNNFEINVGSEMNRNQNRGMLDR